MDIMETEKFPPGKFAMNYGVILGLIMVVISVLTYVTGLALEGAQWPPAIYYLVFPIVIFYAISQYKKRNANILSLSDALKVGVLIGVISAVVFVIYSLIFSYVIDPDFVNQMMDVTKDKMLVENPEMTQEMLDQSMKFVEMFANPWIMGAIWVAMSSLFALIYSLIAGLIMKTQ
ncbi:DUF4199 domain-containing protein [Gelidibacter maritimus]|uniref:DUF4199 domain-containing protein n=1 Tax=Gelidibacter maritimus TaxID=2761487 RepID=A0A7W2R2U5_9FLAO|nr:DUF4199 domain-containing protein [Gelidibacter maritimus]MBA6151270.1 DUF4199 domain-containing protein [Gelidibacter maritimus]